MREIERQVMLRIIDQQWREHLYEMDYLREGINLRAMGQKDPLAEWQREGFDMFEAMMERHRPELRQVRHARAGHVRAEEAARAPRPTGNAVRYLGGRAGLEPRSRPRRRLGPHEVHRRPAQADGPRDADAAEGRGGP